mmetsp:Transcript_22109/g.68853  ORF Transcript_22109/g.68853 Transcript_22109/m.68853 type:complete len:352 (+) Transcript_22109:378-1433(+)
MVGSAQSGQETQASYKSSWTTWWGTNPLAVPLAAGAAAGMAVEVILFPLDCLKTRYQSRLGFWQAGGFRRIYRGVGVTAAGAIPTSAIFFSTYELAKVHCGSMVLASVLGELAACGLRAPVDLAKQRLQAGLARSFGEVVHSLLSTPGSIMYASLRASVARDIVHSGLQYPMYEYLKLVATCRAGFGQVDDLPTWQAAACGSAAGAISATVTTPLDLLKTRLNLRSAEAPAGCGQWQAGAASDSLALVAEEARHVFKSSGLRGFFAGAACRASWMALGGFVFLGSFELVRKHLLDAIAGCGRALPPRVSDSRAPEAHCTAVAGMLAAAAPAAPGVNSCLPVGVTTDVPCWM